MQQDATVISRLRTVLSIQSILMLVLLGLAGIAGESLAPSDIDVRLWALAVIAGLLGITLGVLRVPDSVSHLVAILTGAVTAVTLAALRLPQGMAATPLIDRVTQVVDGIRDWYIGAGTGRQTDDVLIVILLHMIVWLVSYLAAWSLMRQGWVSVAVLLPAIAVIASEVAGTENGSLLEVFLVVSVVLLARMTWVRRAQSGKTPSDLHRSGWPPLVTATVVGILVVTIGVSTPEDFSSSTVQPVAEYASESLLNAQDRAGDWMADRLGIEGSKQPDINDFPRYTAFDDAFSIGGDLNLSDQPEVLVKTEAQAPYITAQSYDYYNGRGWESTVEDTFDSDGPDGVRYAPELTFRPEQEVPYSGSVNDARVQETMQVTPLTPAGNIMFSDGMFSTSNERASVRMSWLQLDETRFTLREMDLSTVPPDLTGIVSLLIRAEDLTVQGDGGLMYPSSLVDRERLQTVRSQLADRFIDVRWTIAEDGRVSDMIVTGQVPVYDDTVTVRRSSGAPPDSSYVVTSMPSVADADQLRAASTDYPSWVTDRYLQLPSTVTPRTVALTNDLAASAPNPYDRAKIIEQFLRGHITYDIEVGIPSRDKDIVDYVLFELQRGYCEHYASAMTVMLRILGVPAKTVVGYFPASYDDAYGGYLYRQENAHAWTEAFFPGYGWIRFEPTASQPESSFEPGSNQGVSTPTPMPTLEPQVPPASPQATPAPVNDDVEPPVAETVPVAEDDGGGGAWALYVLPVVAVAAIGAAIWLALARAPSLDPRALFSGLVRWGRAGGVRGEASVTPREYARHFGQRYPGFARDADEIVDVYEEQRYGGREPEPGRLARAGEALRHLKREVIRRVVRLGR